MIILFLLSFLIATSAQGMETGDEYSISKDYSENAFDFLPIEATTNITMHIAALPLPKACKSLNALAGTNKYWYNVVNDEKNTKQYVQIMFENVFSKKSSFKDLCSLTFDLAEEGIADQVSVHICHFDQVVSQNYSTICLTPFATIPATKFAMACCLATKEARSYSLSLHNDILLKKIEQIRLKRTNKKVQLKPLDHVFLRSFSLFLAEHKTIFKNNDSIFPLFFIMGDPKAFQTIIDADYSYGYAYGHEESLVTNSYRLDPVIDYTAILPILKKHSDHLGNYYEQEFEALKKK